jgi:hypothetical protein
MTDRPSRKDDLSRNRKAENGISKTNASNHTLTLRWVVLIAAIILINLLFANGLADLVEAQLGDSLTASVWLGIAALVLYALLLAIPFVPGVEIGISLLVMQGHAIAPFVHAATVAGLLISFAVGWAFATSLPCQFLHSMGLARACAFVDAMKEMTRLERLEYLEAASPRWIGPGILRHRYLLLALLINLPGNSLIGGGGGILLVAGLSRLFSFPAIVVTLIVATAPVPLAVWLMGAQILE